MGFEPSPKTQHLKARLEDFMAAHVYPNEREYWRRLDGADDRWAPVPLAEDLKTARLELAAFGASREAAVR